MITEDVHGRTATYLRLSESEARASIEQAMADPQILRFTVDKTGTPNRRERKQRKRRRKQGARDRAKR